MLSIDKKLVHLSLKFQLILLERLLFRCTEDSFLVRKSSVKDSYAFSLYNHKKGTVSHTLIVPKDGGYIFQVQ